MAKIKPSDEKSACRMRFVSFPSGNCDNMSPRENLGWAMATIDFECTKKEARSGQTQALKFQFDVKGTALTYHVLSEAEAAFLRWFRAFHSDHALVAWKATMDHRGIIAQYDSSLPYGMPRTDT